jgi:short-subunit dehydrogenase
MGEERGLAVVTGASSGIGAVYAERLAARGHSLLLVARRSDRLARTKDRLASNYRVEVATLVADLERPSDVSDLGRDVGQSCLPISELKAWSRRASHPSTALRNGHREWPSSAFL